MEFTTDQFLYVDLSDAAEEAAGTVTANSSGTTELAKRKRAKDAAVQARRKTPDAGYVDTLRRHGGWMSACQVAKAHGHRLHVVSHGLSRQTELGLLEDDVVSVVGTKRSFEHSRMYRARPFHGWIRRVETLLPGWLSPQAIIAFGDARRICGSASLVRWRK